MLATPRRSIPYPNPDRSDRPDMPLHIYNVAIAADGDVVYSQGTSAARGTATHEISGGQFWWETDTSLLWYDDGSAWHPAGVNPNGSLAFTGAASEISLYGQSAATNAIFASRVAGDTVDRITIDADGTVKWGSGSAAQDTTLYRPGAGVLRLGTTTQANTLQLYGNNTNVLQAYRTTDTNPRFSVTDAGFLSWSPGNTATDLSINRYTTGILGVGTATQRGGVRSFGSAVTDHLFEGLITTDAQLRYFVRADGSIWWGTGAAAVDTNLYRSGVNQLQTDGVLISKSYFYSQNSTVTTSFLTAVAGDAFGRLTINTSGQLSWGSGAAASDTNLYRGGVGLLKTDGQFTVTSTINGGANIVLTGAASSAFVARSAAAITTPILVARAAADTFDRFVMLADGTHQWGGGTSAVDTNLYRPAAGYLKTDGQIQAGSQIAANLGLAAQIVLSSDGGIYFGSAADTVLSRRVAGAFQMNALYITSPSLFLENGAFRSQRHPYGSDRHTENGYFGLGANVTSASVTFTNAYSGAPFLTWSFSYADIVDFPYASSGSLTSQPTTGFTLSLPAVNTARSLYWFAEGPD